MPIKNNYQILELEATLETLATRSILILFKKTKA